MSPTRYVRLQILEFNSFEFDCPVEIEKGALLLDTQTKNVLLQLRLNILNIGKGKVSSVSLKIDCSDDAGDELPELKPFNDTFRDINLMDTQSFGEKTPIVLDKRVRRVKVGVRKVTFNEGIVWHPTGKEFRPPQQKTINSIRTDLHDQLNRELNSKPNLSKERVVYFPQQFESYWLCTCSRPNKNDEASCCRCGISKVLVFQTINEEKLQKGLDSYIDKTRLEEEQKRTVEEERRRRIEQEKLRHSKKIKIASFLVTVIILIALLFFFVGLPFIKYTQAVSLLTNKEYDKAISLFEPLGEYKNSKELQKEANFQKANDLLINKQYDKSISIFTKVKDYKNSKELIYEASYQKANELLANKQFDESIELFTTIQNYKNSVDMIYEAYYQKAVELISNKKFEESINIFSSIPEYKNSNEMIHEVKYQKAVYLLSIKQYAQSKEIFSLLQDYKDSKQYLIEVDYLMAVRYTNDKNIAMAEPIFTNLGDYKDSKKYLIYLSAIHEYFDGNFELAKQTFNDLSGFMESVEYIGKIDAIINIQGTWDDENNTWQFIFNGWEMTVIRCPVSRTYCAKKVDRVENIQEKNVSSDSIILSSISGQEFIYYIPRNTIESKNSFGTFIWTKTSNNTSY